MKKVLVLLLAVLFSTTLVNTLSAAKLFESADDALVERILRIMKNNELIVSYSEGEGDFFIFNTEVGSQKIKTIVLYDEDMLTIITQLPDMSKKQINQINCDKRFGKVHLTEGTTCLRTNILVKGGVTKEFLITQFTFHILRTKEFFIDDSEE